MKRLILIIAVMALILSTGYFVIKNYSSDKYKIVKLKGGDAYTNFSRSDFEWITGADSDSISALPLYDGDLIYILSGVDELPFHRYKENDGNYLDFDIEDFVLYINGNIVAFELSKNEDFMEWLNGIETEDIQDLRYISVSDYSPDIHKKYLKKIARTKPDIGLFIDEDITDLGDILDMFDTEWIAAGGCEFDEETKKKIANEKSLELLYIGEDSWDLDILSKLPKLESLILVEIPQPENDKPLVNNNLKLLTIIKSGIRDISSLSNLTNLTELYLLDCDSLTSINSIDKFENLKCLSLVNCDNLTDIDVLENMTSLKWISFNPGITEKELDDFIKDHKGIEVVELTYCKNINDVSPFRKLKKLSCFTYFETEVDINSVYDLKGLEYLSLPDSLYENTIDIGQIQEKNPNCVIVPNAGFCLGSGWLLLIIPALIAGKLILMVARRNKS
ncbi:MAG: hypothetical protein JSV22_10295 [Bacteroidales bacterium]|nr:MAG: hypothetical protein JSV22_10295 [Bacteroidales bacterium]